MDAVCDPHIYIGYFNFGHPGSMNDINVLDRSIIVGSILNQTFYTKVDSYKINGKQRDWLYFLADGIYPPWSIFTKMNPAPINEKEEKYFNKYEHVKKDMERAFGVVISKFVILERQLRGWHIDDLRMLINCCIIMHNMVIEVRREFFSFYELAAEMNEEAVNIDDSDGEVEEVTILFPDEEVDLEQIWYVQQMLINRVARMPASIEELKKHQELSSDLQPHMNN